MKSFFRILIYCFLLLSTALTICAQEKDKDSLLSDKTFLGLKLRNIGPAMMSGRMADIAINPDDPSELYIDVGSGGVWKTTNAGITWKPVFERN